ncbi:hypothetical protein UPYG_G00118580 [Umbra pygmaea]|uniref:Uncharacterized protein n=1 Tax=Umbra pygmaea TaxID=75934 RepID=A0ABD0X4R0_UMBPY
MSRGVLETMAQLKLKKTVLFVFVSYRNNTVAVFAEQVVRSEERLNNVVRGRRRLNKREQILQAPKQARLSEKTALATLSPCQIEQRQRPVRGQKAQGTDPIFRPDRAVSWREHNTSKRAADRRDCKVSPTQRVARELTS